MYLKVKKSESENVAEDSWPISPDSEKDQQETEILTSTDNNKDGDPVEKKIKNGSLSEKFFLSDPPED